MVIVRFASCVALFVLLPASVLKSLVLLLVVIISSYIRSGIACAQFLLVVV